MSAALASIATALETAAGGATSANANEAGYWKRIVAAAETLAGDGTTANENQMGRMKRTAVALEFIAGTDGTAENTNESGYMKRIVDALEVQAGAVTVGSLMGRLVIAAGDATFGVANLFPDPLVDDSLGYTFQAPWSYDTSSLFSDGASTSQTAATLSGSSLNTACLAAIAASTAYQVRIRVSGWVQGTISCRLRFGAYTNLVVTGDGWFGPVTVTAGVGSTACVQFRGESIAGGTTARIEEIEILP